jgi:TRAP-type C4-dicarboxylate transport system substrate-binding protein
MFTVRRGSRGVAGLAGAGLVGVLALTGCAEEAGGSGNGGSGGTSTAGVEYGATKDEWIEALADIDPITIKAQSPSPEGAVTGAKFEGYMAAVEEWSGGKITFDIAFANAVAPPLEVDNALADGRLELGSVVPSFEPQEYPANAAFGASTQQGPNGPFAGTMISNTWWLDVAYDTPEMFQEGEDHGFHIIQPAYNSGLITLMCAEPKTGLSDLEGSTVIVGNQSQAKAVEGFGGASVSMAYPEIFEALQRGVADCSLNSLLVAELGGFTSEVPHVVSDPDAGFGSGAGAWAFSSSAWESYPLEVQQLLFDKLDAFMVSNFESIWTTIEGVVDDAVAADGSFSEFDDDAEASVQETNESILAELRENPALGDGEAFVDNVESSIDKWTTTITEDLGYEEVPYEEFSEFYAPGEVDLDALTESVFEEILLEHRPS